MSIPSLYAQKSIAPNYENIEKGTGLPCVLFIVYPQ